MSIKPEDSYLSAFLQVSQPLLEKFYAAGISRKFERNNFVTHRGDVWPHLLFVRSGEFEVIKESTQGRSFVIETFHPGEFFWGIALFEADKPNPAAFRAAEDGEILIWNKGQIETAIAADTQFAWGLFTLLAKKMGRISEILEDLVFLPLAGRLANLLIDQSGSAVDGYVSRDLTLEDMAARIGTTREMVCKLLYQFSDKGIIELHRTEFKVIDPIELQTISERFKG